MANININIEVQQSGSSYSLRLTDSKGDSGTNNLVTPATPGDVITWSISSDVANVFVAINDIDEKNSSQYNVFTGAPAELSQGNGIWSATVNPNISSDQTESYFIKYDITIGGNTTTYTDDPEIQVVTGG